MSRKLLRTPSRGDRVVLVLEQSSLHMHCGLGSLWTLSCLVALAAMKEIKNAEAGCMKTHGTSTQIWWFPFSVSCRKWCEKMTEPENLVISQKKRHIRDRTYGKGKNVFSEVDRNEIREHIASFNIMCISARVNIHVLSFHATAFFPGTHIHGRVRRENAQKTGRIHYFEPHKAELSYLSLLLQLVRFVVQDDDIELSIYCFELHDAIFGCWWYWSTELHGWLPWSCSYNNRNTVPRQFVLYSLVEEVHVQHVLYPAQIEVKFSSPSYIHPFDGAFHWPIGFCKGNGNTMPPAKPHEATLSS